MFSSRALGRFASCAVVVLAVTACAAQHGTVEDQALQKSYELTAPVTGSRIERKIDPATGSPNVPYVITTLNGDGARAVIRNRLR
jgi:hypothetical protein